MVNGGFEARAALWRVVIGVALAALVLTYFDLLSVRYDDGLKIRVGVDPEILKQKQILQKEEQKKQDLEAEHKAIIKRFPPRWVGFFDGTVDYSALFHGPCVGIYRMDLEMQLMNFNETTETGEATFSMHGEVLTTPNGSTNTPGCAEALGLFSIRKEDDHSHGQIIRYTGDFKPRDDTGEKDLLDVRLIRIFCATGMCPNLDGVLHVFPSGSATFVTLWLSVNLNPRGT